MVFGLSKLYFPDVNLEFMAMRWLWLEKDCHYILEQRTPRHCGGIPDVIGITKARFLVEIEIKRSAADFKADFLKHQRKLENLQPKYRARFFYYMMPRELAEKLLPQMPEHAGLLCNSENNYTATVLKRAVSNPASERLSVKECVRACRMMVNHMMTKSENLHTTKSNFIHRDSQSFVHWVKADQGTYEI